MTDDYTTNSHYLAHTFLFRNVGRMYFFNLGAKEVKSSKSSNFLFHCPFFFVQDEMSPIQHALETMESANKGLRSLIGRHKTDTNLSISPLSMKLKGILDATVMGGISNYEKVANTLLVSLCIQAQARVTCDQAPSFPSGP